MARSSAETDLEGGEGYFASVSDLMVGILFVFLLMLTVLALNFREAEQQQVVALERYERVRIQAEEDRRRAQQQEELARERTAEAEVLRGRNERLEAALDAAIARLQQDIREREEARADLLARLATALAVRGVAFHIDQQSGVLRLTEDVPFAISRSDLTERTRRTVQILAEVFARLLPCFASSSDRTDCGPRDRPILEAVLIEGHTDQQGTVSNNDRLSAERALTVFAEMRRLQPSLEQIRNADSVPLLGISGYGQRRPVALGSDEAAFAQNRRIDIRFVLSSRTSEDVERMIQQVHSLRQVPP